MRLTLEIRSRILSIGWDRADPATEREPDPQGSTCGDLERAERWDHDSRVPIGFQVTG